MAELTTQITSVRLARDRARLFVAPVVFILVAVATVGWGLLLGGPGGFSLIAVGGLAILVAAYLVALVSSYRLLVEPGELRLVWLGGERRYRLVRGAVTRVAVRGENAAALAPRFGAFGWAVGPATLRGDEPIELIRLSRRPPLIVAPTDRGRLAIAAAVESDLLAAMTHAVRLQERLDEVAARRAAPPPAPEVAPRPIAPPAPRILTGIERTLIEQRLAAERAAAQAAAEAELAGAAAAVVHEETPEPEVAPAPETAARRGRSSRRAAAGRSTSSARPVAAAGVAVGAGAGDRGCRAPHRPPAHRRRHRLDGRDGDRPPDAADRRSPDPAHGTRPGRSDRSGRRAHRPHLVPTPWRPGDDQQRGGPGDADTDHPRLGDIDKAGAALRRSAQSKTAMTEPALPSEIEPAASPDDESGRPETASDPSRAGGAKRREPC